MESQKCEIQPAKLNQPFSLLFTARSFLGFLIPTCFGTKMVKSNDLESFSSLSYSSVVFMKLVLFSLKKLVFLIHLIQPNW